MPIDIAILIIILIFALLGFRRGFAYTFFRTFGWIVAIVAAILLRGRFADFLAERTSLYDVFLAHTEKIFHTFAEKYATGFAESMPVLIGDAVEKAKDKIVSETAVRIADASFEIFAFIGLILLIKIALFILTLLLSKRHHEGFIGGIDGIGGFFIGAAQGVVVVLILSALILPVLLAINVEYYAALEKMLDRALFADILCNNNPLLDFINELLPSDLLPSDWLDAKPQNTAPPKV